MHKLILRLSLVLGLALFAVVIIRSGPGQILAAIARLTPAQWLVLLVLRAVYWVLRTFNWKQIFDVFETKRPFVRLFEARLADNAVGFLTPSAMLGGLPVRASMIGGTDRRRVFASVVVDKTIEVFTMSFYTVLAMLAAIILLPMPPAARITFGLFIVLAAALCAVLWIGQRRGFFGGLFGGLARFGIRPRWVERNGSRIRDIDTAIAGFYRRRPSPVPPVIALYTLSYLVWAAEIDVSLRFLGAPGLTLIKSLLVISLGNVALLFPTVPASLGVYEATNVGVFAVLGWPAGLAVALAVIRRLLALFWTALGLGALFWRQRRPATAGPDPD